MRRSPKRPALTLVQGNPDAPAYRPIVGPLRVLRYGTAPDVAFPDAVTLAAVTEDNRVIGVLTLPFACMDMMDMEWLQKRAERLLGTRPTLLQ